ncbi:MAG: hypothetical protein AAB250_10610, partial [Bdellovibrionota bacterium]
MASKRLQLSLFAFLVAVLTVVPWNGSAYAQSTCRAIFNAKPSLAHRLSNAAIVSFEKVQLDGKTEHYIVHLAGGLKAIFKPSPEFWGADASKDVWARKANIEAEVIAYEIDAAMGLGFVPPTVIRNIRGMRGSLQLWVAPDGTRPSRRFLAMLSAFDYLLNNLDRSGADFKATEDSRNLHTARGRPVALDNALALQPLQDFQLYATRDPVNELDLPALQGDFSDGLRALSRDRLRAIMSHPRYDEVLR